MPMTFKVEDADRILRDTTERESLGELESFYYAIQRPNMFVMILFAGLLTSFMISYYYIGCTATHLVIQKLSSFANPKGGAYIVPWEHVQIIEVRSVTAGKKVTLRVQGKQYKFIMSSKLRKWNKNIPRFDNFIESFLKRMNY
ncbi:MAG: hypothetical protein GY870_09785 [archaeon]|nr:hypothetical protein [archaeon]